jgi:hypothetical protein
VAWTTLPTYSDGNILTAAQLNAIAANINETAPAKATATGQMFVSTAANTLAARTPSRVKTAGAAQATTSATPADLTTVGPTVGPLATGISAIYVVSTFISHATAQSGGYMGMSVSGASTIAMDLLDSLRLISEVASVKQKASYVGMCAGTLTAGNNSFKAQYASTTGGTSAIFEEREAIVIPL